MDYDLDRERNWNNELLVEVSRLWKANDSLKAEWAANSVEHASLTRKWLGRTSYNTSYSS